MKICVINEECHGYIGTANSQKSAIKWLVTSNWITRDTMIWVPDPDDMCGGTWRRLHEIYSINTKAELLDVLFRFSEDDWERTGFTFTEEDLIGDNE